MKIGVVTFPGSLDDTDARRAARTAGAEAVALWHGDADLHGVDAVVLPGGFSYGDYLRAGAISRALIKNVHRKFICKDQRLRIENNTTAWTSAYDAGQEVTIVLKNQDGFFVADDRTLDQLEGDGRVIARYLDGNPNGSYRDIAGITNERGNVVGLMPHPEHCIDTLTGPGTDGLAFFTSVIKTVTATHGDAEENADAEDGATAKAGA